MRVLNILLICWSFIFILSGCVQKPGYIREEIPEMYWPKPPEDPRIVLLDSFSGPEDLNLQQSLLGRFFAFISGGENRFIVKPYGVEVDREGRYFVVDTLVRCVHVFDMVDKDYYCFPGDRTVLASPIDIAVQEGGRIFVTDSKNSVVKIFEQYGKKYVGEIGDQFLKRPTGIAINKKTDELLVVDTMASQIIRYDIKNLIVKGVIGLEGEQSGMFHSPTNIFTSDNGFIYVTDSLNFKIHILSPTGDFISSFGKVGNGPGYFSRPRGVAVDSEENIYVVDGLFDNVQIFSREGDLLLDFGSTGSGYGEFWLPSGIFIDSNDRIYVSDTYNRRIQVFKYVKEGEF